MELFGQTSFNEDLYFMFQRRNFYEANIPLEMNDLFSGACGIDHYFDRSNCLDTDLLTPEDFSVFNEVYDPLRDQIFMSRIFESSQYPQPRNIAYSWSSPYEVSRPLALPEDQFQSPSHCFLEEEEGLDTVDGFRSLEEQGAHRKAESAEESLGEVPGINCVHHGRKGRTKKSGSGQPSKNLMAERRRRKRLNDRLSMLRSIVPKISKMDRTSILGDTIDYMKELLQNIDRLQHLEPSLKQFSIFDVIKDMKPNEMLVRNSPKFNVKKRHEDMNIEVCCAMKPGLVLSTVNTLESLGLEIEKCVVSCFSDFAMQASCSHQGLEQMAKVTTGDVKQALFRNAGYGGKCL